MLNQSGTNSPTNAWDWFDVGVQLTDLDGMAQGCTATVQLPSIFGGMQATTLYLNADGGYTTTPQADTVATMSIDPDTRTMTFVLTDYAATHQDVDFDTTAEAVARHYGPRFAAVPVGADGGGILDGWLVDDATDSDVPARLASTGIEARAVPLMMTDVDATAAICAAALALAEDLRR